MTLPSKSFLTPITSSEVRGFSFWCPGCENRHVFYVKGTPAQWTFNEDMKSPTFSPSLLNTWEENGVAKRCHLFLRAGQLEFCSDSLHPLAGQTVPLGSTPCLDSPEEYRERFDGMLNAYQDWLRYREGRGVEFMDTCEILIKAWLALPLGTEPDPQTELALHVFEGFMPYIYDGLA